MKLNQCTLGKLVITEDKKVGHIVGLTYNISLDLTGYMLDQEKFERTIPLVRFPDGERGIHYSNLSEFK